MDVLKCFCNSEFHLKIPAAIIEGDCRDFLITKETASDDAEFTTHLAVNMAFTVSQIDTRPAGIWCGSVGGNESSNFAFSLRPGGAEGKKLKHGIPKPSFIQRIFVRNSKICTNAIINGSIAARKFWTAG
jgi:hypothetical protein